MKRKEKHHSLRKCPDRKNLLVVITLDHGLGASTTLAAKAQLDAWLRCTGIRHWSCVASLSLPVGEFRVLGCLFSELLNSGFLYITSVFGSHYFVSRNTYLDQVCILVQDTTVLVVGSTVVAQLLDVLSELTQILVLLLVDLLLNLVHADGRADELVVVGVMFLRWQLNEGIDDTSVCDIRIRGFLFEVHECVMHGVKN
jgi:hypothetical protein